MAKKEYNFPYTAVQFLTDLRKNNNKEWFEANRERFNLFLLQPALQFVVDLGDELRALAPEINAIPKIDKSIFRLHRDVRFSKDKSPFKTNLGLYFWEGKKKRMECSGFYFHAEPGLYFMGNGMYEFDKSTMKRFREIVSDPVKAEELSSIIKKISRKYDVKGIKYKKVPRGFDPDYKYSELLKHGGLYAMVESKNLNELYTGDAVRKSAEFFKNTLPLHRWLVENLVV